MVLARYTEAKLVRKLKAFLLQHYRPLDRAPQMARHIEQKVPAQRRELEEAARRWRATQKRKVEERQLALDLDACTLRMANMSLSEAETRLDQQAAARLMGMPTQRHLPHRPAADSLPQPPAWLISQARRRAPPRRLELCH